MIYRRVTNAHGRIEIVLAQNVGKGMALIERSTGFNEFSLKKKPLNKSFRNAYAAQVLELRTDLRKFIEEKNA